MISTVKEKEAKQPLMGLMITISMVIHLFFFMRLPTLNHIKPEQPAKIEVTLQEIQKNIEADKPPAPMPEPLPAAATPTVTEDSIIKREPTSVPPEPPVKKPDPVEEKKERTVPPVKKEKPLKKKRGIERKKDLPKKIEKEVVVPDPVKTPPAKISEVTERLQNVQPVSAVTPQKNFGAREGTISSSGAPAVRKTAADHDPSRIYFSAMRLKIEKNKHYPGTARRRHQEGNVRVRFFIDRAGNVNRLEIVKKSEYEALNRAAIEAVEKAAPFTKPPDSIAGDSLKLELTIQFTLI